MFSSWLRGGGVQEVSLRNKISLVCLIDRYRLKVKAIADKNFPLKQFICILEFNWAQKHVFFATYLSQEDIYWPVFSCKKNKKTLCLSKSRVLMEMGTSEQKHWIKDEENDLVSCDAAAAACLKIYFSRKHFLSIKKNSFLIRTVGESVGENNLSGSANWTQIAKKEKKLVVIKLMALLLVTCVKQPKLTF